MDSNVLNEKAAKQTASCFAVYIAATPAICLCTWDASIELDGYTYTKSIPIKSPNLYSNYNSGGRLSIGNVDGTFTSLIINGSLKNKDISIYEVYFSDTNSVIGYETLFKGKISGQKFDKKWCDLTLSPFASGSDIMVPRRRIVPSCGFKFKGNDCGYSGASTYCSKIYADCLNEGNPFGGFRFTPVPGRVVAWGNVVIMVD